MSATNVTTNTSGSKSLLVQHLKPPPPSAGGPVLAGWEQMTRQTQDEVNVHAANPSFPRVMATKKHPYNVHVTRPSSGHIVSHPLKKGGLSHGQIISLVAHALDVSDVGKFQTAMETLKTGNGQFPDTVPFCVRQELYDEFCGPRPTEKPTETIVKIADDSDSGDVTIISHGRAAVRYATLGKTPVWAIAHGLERVSSCKKQYKLENCTFKELGEVADDAYLIKGLLNSKNPPSEVSEHNKHIPCRPEMKFLDCK